MIEFDRLILNGFKSFADKTELEIGPGLNGVIGPNGCGKSNVVEALRWVMGEGSAKKMRGSGMEDVIFSGTEKRARRQSAEISLRINNQNHEAPAPYKNLDEILITRKIERDRGSSYKINGQNVRARDVAMFFADTLTGANSPALISQGRVAQMIAAKPAQRRMILEESANIAGLFARRHESELRLNAAERNLSELQNVIDSMDARLAHLKKQARQAQKYKNFNTEIRLIEAIIFIKKHDALSLKIDALTKECFSSDDTQKDLILALNALTKTEASLSEKLPVLRNSALEAAASAQNKRISLQKLEDDYARQTQAFDDLKAQKLQLAEDLEHEQHSLDRAIEGSQKIDTEIESLNTDESALKSDLQKTGKAIEEIETKIQEDETLYNAKLQSNLERNERIRTLESQISRLQEQKQRSEEKISTFEENLKRLEEKSEETAPLKSFEQKLESLKNQIESAKTQKASVQTTIKTFEQRLNDQRQASLKAQGVLDAQVSEKEMLEALIKADDEDEFKQLRDVLDTQQGFEKAVSRALNDGLTASLDEKAKTRWLSRTDKMILPDLPEGLASLSDYARGPEALQPCLTQIALADDKVQALGLFEKLQPGQSIVTREGFYIRWDGYCVEDEARDTQSVYLEQKNRLAGLDTSIPKARLAAEEAEDEIAESEEELASLETSLAGLQTTLEDLENDFNHTKDTYLSAKESVYKIDTDIENIQKLCAHEKEALAKTTEDLKNCRKELDQYGQKSNKSDANEQALERLRTDIEAARTELKTLLQNQERLKQSERSREVRLRALADEKVNLRNQKIQAEKRIDSLKERQKAVQEKLESAEIQTSPPEEQKQILLEELNKAEQQKANIQNTLNEAEEEWRLVQSGLKSKQESLSSMRENKARAQAELGMIKEQREEHMKALRAKFGCSVDELRRQYEDPLNKPEYGDHPALEEKRNKLTAQREALGPVNLQAVHEAEELDKELSTITGERDDLTNAIHELRGGIRKINSEARQRLINAFDQINAHFKALFSRLFGGGQAYLELIEADDPLEAGLEIYAQPPGKTLQSLSLLSGGEQALASIALIFAMFLTSPSPICVLDEIDAPLDDSNVSRVCDLLDDIVKRGRTRFIIVTHHRLTMARMDRLYGVTMAEKGVSQLVSVDLQQSFSFLDKAA